MGQELAGKVAIVTGGASGLGRATVELFVEEGARVVIADANADLGEELASQLGDAVAFKRTDVADAGQVQALVDFTVARFGGLHAMFNNAGISSSRSRFIDDELQDFDRVIGVNLFGVMVCSQRAARHMAANGGGAIVNTASIAGINAGAGPDLLSRVQGGGHPLQPVDRHRPRRARDPRELPRAGAHRDRDQHQLRRVPDHSPHATAATRRDPTRRRRTPSSSW